MENFWDGFAKQAGIAQMVSSGIKSLGATATNLGAKGIGNTISGAAPKIARGVGRVTNTVNQMGTAGKLGLGAAGGVGAGYMAFGGQPRQPQY